MTTTSLEETTPMQPNEISMYMDKASAWDVSRIDSLERSERRAWVVAMIAIGCLAIACTGIALMLPLKETTPYVVRVDGNGVPTIVTAMEDQIVTGDDVMDKYWLAKYVISRETYDAHTLEQDYNTVGMLSDTTVGRGYAAQFQGDSAVHERLADTVTTTVDVLSVVVSPYATDTATVRFQTVTARTATGSVIDTDNWVATIAYEYQNTAPMDELLRLVNPYGFRVTSYRLDPEHTGGES